VFDPRAVAAGELVRDGFDHWRDEGLEQPQLAKLDLEPDGIGVG
jgi:hypothetical protein